MPDNVTKILDKLASIAANQALEDYQLKELTSSLSLALPSGLALFLALMYMLTAIVGLVGNCMVIVAVVRTPSLRTESNAYIAVLAISDCLLVSLASPATLLQISTSSWILGRGVFGRLMCVMTGFSPIFLTFMSTFLIICISLDRHRIIVHSSNKASKSLRTKLAVVCCAAMAGLCALPMTFTMKVVTHDIPFGGQVLERNYCGEHWDIPHGRLCYSIVIFGVQLVLPSLIISLAHCSINRRLKTANIQRSKLRLYKTQRLLITVIIVFTLSWLPLNLINILLDLRLDHLFGLDMQHTSGRVVFALFHLIGMSSSVSNPIIYGYFNKGFRKVFRRYVTGSRTPTANINSNTNKGVACLVETKF